MTSEKFQYMTMVDLLSESIAIPHHRLHEGSPIPEF
eukprot:CAMPEP_0183775516 /NCGR_PEP_ID=MMETSP0739-20130205/44664_1 /TAXON_ID=385413 /ORGANISM="Thalassiosira miniscula, Strain CCMP1093" /LENGTH=35 /DNA_ID= /DNA_START= /DNA_END= /DNA_ORIENTATION=